MAGLAHQPHRLHPAEDLLDSFPRSLTLPVGRWERGRKRPAIQFMPGVLMLLGPDPSATQKSLPGERLRSARQLLGLSQAGLAAKLGVDRGTVGDWERGVRLPAEERLAAVEALLSPDDVKPA